MNKRTKKELRDQPLHFAMTAAPLAVVVFVPPQIWPETLAAFWFMWWREDSQHRPDEGWRWAIPWGYKIRFLDRGIWQQQTVGGIWRYLDIGCGTLGGLVVGLIRYFT